MTTAKTTIIISLLLNTLIVANSQDLSFTDMANLPEARSAVTSANDGESIFVVNGFGISEPYTTEIFQYNVTQDAWTTLTAASVPKRYASAAIIGDYLYVFNGAAETGLLNYKVEKINLNDGSIEILSDNPRPSRAAGVATWDNKIYTFGGTVAPNEYTNKLYEFDPQNDSWTELVEIPFAGETKGEIVDGKLYIFGGYNGMISDRIDIYNMSTDTWESNFLMPNGISAHATAVIDNKIYLVGDFANLSSMAYFDTVDDSFHTLSSNLNERRHCAAEGIGESLFAIGGNTVSSIQSSISSVQKADILTSIDDVSNIKLFEVYPNPTTNVLLLNAKFDEVTIYDVDGKEVKKYSQVRQVEINGLKSGLYFLKGYIGKDIFQSKFMKF